MAREGKWEEEKGGYDGEGRMGNEEMGRSDRDIGKSNVEVVRKMDMI